MKIKLTKYLNSTVNLLTCSCPKYLIYIWLFIVKLKTRTTVAAIAALMNIDPLSSLSIPSGAILEFIFSRI